MRRAGRRMARTVSGGVPGDNPRGIVYVRAVIKSTGLLLAAADVSPDDVAAALNDQGGPSWDRTVFRLLSGVDVGTLAAGKPKAGAGTAVSLASSGWWLRMLDDVAQRLAERSGQPVLAVFESPGAVVSGWHLARPGAEPVRVVEAGRVDAGRGGVAALTGADPGDVAHARDIATVVHGEDPKGAHLPGLFNLTLRKEHHDEWLALLDVRGEALVAGLDWRPSDRPPVFETEAPVRMRSVVLQTPVRLPGPPRWARATRAVAIRAAEAAMREDGWVCLVPTLGGEPAVYGTAVQMLQVAPLGDGSAMGVLHPRFAVRVGVIREGYATVDVLDPGSSTSDELHDQLDLLLDRLRGARLEVGVSEKALRTSPDPAALLAWQLKVDGERGQSYLAARSPADRLEVLCDALVS